MGAADVVPGVSGGTIAFISGIYEELLGSISAVNTSLFKKFKEENPCKSYEPLSFFSLSLNKTIFHFLQ